MIASVKSAWSAARISSVAVRGGRGRHFKGKPELVRRRPSSGEEEINSTAMSRPPIGKTRSRAFRLARGLLITIATAYVLIAGAVWYLQAGILFHPGRIVDATPADAGVKFDKVTLPLGDDRI